MEEAKKKTEDLARQREEALKKRLELNTRTRVIAQAAPPLQEPPRQEPPKAAPAPAPVAVAPAPVAAQPKPAQVANNESAEIPPTITNRVPPVAPRMAIKNLLPLNLRNTDIKVSLKVFVDAHGRPLKVVITNGVEGPYGFNDSAQNAALASSYSPAQRNGKSTTGWVNIEYNFGRTK